MNYFVVNNSTGRVERNGQCARSDLLLQAKAGQTAIEGIADEAKYFSEGSLINRPDSPITASSLSVGVGESVVFSNIPLDTLITYSNQEILVNDPMDLNLSWSSLTPGTFFFRFENFPYLEKKFTVEVI